ncbi:MAG TPA: hypothetical protein VGA37_03610 [Gemmatimonadales bacterium]
MAYQPEIEKLEQRYDADPSRFFAQLAEAYRRQGRFEDALQTLRPHLEERPDYVSGLIVLGRCLLDTGVDGEAFEVFERVLTVDAEHIIALKALAELAERGGNPTGARGWLDRLLEVDPMNEEAQAALERIAAMPPTEGAEPAAAGAVALEPADADPIALEASEAVEAPAEAAEADRITGFEPTVAELDLAPVAEAVPEAGGAGATPSVDDIVIERASEAYEALEASDIGEIELVRSEEAELAVSTPETPEIPPTVEVPAIEIADTVEMSPIAAGTGDESPADDGDETGSDLGIQPFDTDLGWGTGERISRQISAADLDAAERAHDANVEPPAHELPGLENAEVPLVGHEFESGAAADATLSDLPEAEDAADDLLALEDAPGEWEGEATLTPEPSGEVDDFADVPIPDGGLDVDLGPDFVAELEPAEPMGEDAVASGPITIDDEVTTQMPAISLPEASDTTYELPEVDVAPPEAEWIEPSPHEPVPAESPEGSEDAWLERSPPDRTPERLEEPVVSAQVPEEGEGWVDEEDDATLEGLPVFLPDEQVPADGSAGVDPSGPQPVVTETMAEVYVSQGLMAEAAEVYRTLLAANPMDERLAGRLAELEQTLAGPTAEAAVAVSGAVTGAPTARAMLLGVLAARPAGGGMPRNSGSSTEQIAPRAPAESAETPMDVAFADEPVEPRGAPTMPAQDEMSLASVFGEAPAPKPPAVTGSDKAKDSGAAAGFSFDEFFGGEKPDQANPSRPRRDTLADDEGDDAFRDWLKGLKS